MRITSRWDGAFGQPNKRQRREEKRQEAEERNAKTAPERRRSFARAAGFNRNSDRLREESKS